MVVLPDEPEGFGVEYVDADGARRRVGLAECWTEPTLKAAPATTYRYITLKRS